MSQHRSIDALISVGGKRDGSIVQDPRSQAGFSQRDAYWIEDGGFHDKNVKWISLDYVVDQPRCLA
jgi:hypothetical protein